LCCANTIGPAICTAPIGEAQQNKNGNLLLALQICSASPIGAANIPRFAYKCPMPHIILAVGTALYSPNTIGATLLAPLQIFFQNSPIIWAVLTGNGKKVKTRWRQPKTTK
jgi:hypothetical protein